jgi:hypothetical protein
MTRGEPLTLADLLEGMPVRVHRPGVRNSGEEMLVQMDFPIAHLRNSGWEFVRISRRIVRRDGSYVMELA